MSVPPLESDRRFWILKEAIASYAGDPDDPPVQDDDVLQAAVALVVRGRPDLEVLLIKRASHEGDPWSGHMALPGGRREDRDPSLLDTARRETREEVGLNLEDEGRVLGRLADVAPNSPLLPRFTITPFVFAAPPNAKARVASPEVAAVQWVPVRHFQAPENHTGVEISTPGGVRTFPGYRVRDGVVWGLTYRILRQFLALMPEFELDADG